MVSTVSKPLAGLTGIEFDSRQFQSGTLCLLIVDLGQAEPLFIRSIK
jgi:hypothetical protein